MPDHEPAGPGALTPTEEMLLAFAREGMRHAEMAVRLGIPISSVKARFEELDRRSRRYENDARPAAGGPAPQASPSSAQPVAPGPSRGVLSLASLAGAAAVLGGVILFFLDGSGSDEAAPAPRPARPSFAHVEAKPTELDLLVAALAAEGEGGPGSLQFGPPIRIDATFALVTKSRGATGATGLDRVYIPPGSEDPVREPLYRIPPGARLTASAGSFDGARLALIYEDADGAFLAWSDDGGVTWYDPLPLEPGATINLAGAANLVVGSPGATGWLALDSGTLQPLQQPPGTTGPPLGEDATGALLWRGEDAGHLVDAAGRHATLAYDGRAATRINAYASLGTNGLAIVLWSSPQGVFTSLAGQDGVLGTTFFSSPWSPAGTAATLRVVGNHCPAAYPETETPGLPCVAVLFHPGTGTLHPIIDPILDPDQFDPAPVVAAQAGPFALVLPGGCTPLLLEPGTASPVDGCAASGRLLTLANPGDLGATGPIDPHFARSGSQTFVEVYGPQGAPRWVDEAGVQLGFVPPFP